MGVRYGCLLHVDHYRTIPMKLKTDEIGSLLHKPATPTPSKMRGATRSTAKRCGREIARANELGCMSAVAKYGHLRIAELARAVWPKARFGEQLAGRTVQRLVKQGLLLARRNALGAKSLCLTRAGAAWLEVRGIEAQHTLDLSSVSGPTFFHRTMATRFLIEQANSGQHVAGEYEILRRKLPFSIDAMSKALRKLPDGYLWSRLSDGTYALEILEQEAAAKARAELERCLRAVTYVGSRLPGDAHYKVSGVTFVFDRSLNHARRIALAAHALWGDKPAMERIALEKRVKLVAVEIRAPLVWVSHCTMTLHDYRAQRM